MRQHLRHQWPKAFTGLVKALRAKFGRQLVTAAGTAYAKCGSQWWSYDTPETASAKAGYARSQKSWRARARARPGHPST